MGATVSFTQHLARNDPQEVSAPVADAVAQCYLSFVPLPVSDPDPTLGCRRDPHTRDFK